MNRVTFVALSLVFLVAGVVLLIAAARRLARRHEFLALSATAEGRVVGFRKQRESGADRESYFPQLEFRTLAGHPVRFESSAGSEQPSRRVGDAVRVRYRTDAPNEAEIDELFALWGLPLVLGGLGAICGAVGASLLLGWIPA